MNVKELTDPEVAVIIDSLAGARGLVRREGEGTPNIDSAIRKISSLMTPATSSLWITDEDVTPTDWVQFAKGYLDVDPSKMRARTEELFASLSMRLPDDDRLVELRAALVDTPADDPADPAATTQDAPPTTTGARLDAGGNPMARWMGMDPVEVVGRLERSLAAAHRENQEIRRELRAVSVAHAATMSALQGRTDARPDNPYPDEDDESSESTATRRAREDRERFTRERND